MKTEKPEAGYFCFYDCARWCHYEFYLDESDRVVEINILPEKGSAVPKTTIYFNEAQSPLFVQHILRLEFFLAPPFLNAVRSGMTPEGGSFVPPHVNQRKGGKEVDVMIQQRPTKKPCRGA